MTSQAWNNVNLTRLAEKIKSPLVLLVVAYSLNQLILISATLVDTFERQPQARCRWTTAIPLYMAI